MQQKSNKFSTAKERIIKYIDYKGISKYSFSKETGLSNGFLNSGSSISSDNMRLLYNIYKDLDMIWLITGEGEMLCSSTQRKSSDTDVSTTVQGAESEAHSNFVTAVETNVYKQLLKEKEQENRELMRRIWELEKELGQNRG